MSESRTVLAEGRLLGLILLIICLVLLYVYGAMQSATHVNTDLTRSDQSAYMNYARRLYEERLNYHGDRNRMPAYPLLQSLFYDPSLSDEAFFAQGKHINILFSLAILCLFYPILASYFDRLHAAILVLITAFSVFVFKAAYFQAELLFYFLAFCSFLLLTRLLIKPTPGAAALTGVVLGLTHLTKASILPAIVLFGVCFLLYHGPRMISSLRRGQSLRKIAHPLLSGLLVVALFLGTIWPYIQNSKRIFGHYFYNFNSTFYMWYNSWDEVKEGTRAHGDRRGWPDMPPEEIPSARRYFQEHTTAQIINRVTDGAQHVTRHAIRSFGYHRYVLAYGLIALAAALSQWRKSSRFLRLRWPLVLFWASYLVSYFILYSWYFPIYRGGDRFILAQFLPYMFIASFIIHSAWQGISLRLGRWRIAPLVALNIVVATTLVPDIYIILTQRILVLYGGS
jgi:hypothetical protein